MAGWSKMNDGSGVNCIENRQVIDLERNGNWFDDGDALGKMGFEDLDDMRGDQSDAMAGCSNPKHGSGRNSVDNRSANETSDCRVDVDDDEWRGEYFETSRDEIFLDERSRAVFDQVLMVLLRGVYAKNGVSAVPVVLGDGRELDLFKLFCLVNKQGGFGLVSKGKMWGNITKKCGFDSKFAAALKLVYFKYLTELDDWMNRINRAGISRNGGYQCSGNMGFLSLELAKTVRGFPENHSEPRGKDEKLKSVNFDEVCKRRLGLHENLAMITSDKDKNMCNSKRDDIELVQGVVENNKNPGKRKRDMLSGMLSWISEVAKDPINPSIGRIPEPSKWKENSGDTLWSLVLWAREATSRRKYGDTKEPESPSPSQPKKLKMHPSMYEDPVTSAHCPIEGLRCSSRRLPPSNETTLPCSSTCPLTETKRSNPIENKEPVKVASCVRDPIDALSCDDLRVEKHVLIGPQYQAQIPPWRGAIHDSDAKWLGTKIWPPDEQNHDHGIATDSLGKGPSITCGCRLSGSMGCIRFHIAEKRVKLKLELGSAFYRWKFDQMGEEISLSWSAKEDKRFRQVMRTEVSFLGKSYFPKKTRKELVSYYYNVFLIKRRSYQNRVTPRTIDSDDDESEFGSIGGPFGEEAIKVEGLGLISCVQNEQCFDLG
ncbi:AT-rich interactive domain-containing protein [Drosera capensis]